MQPAPDSTALPLSKTAAEQTPAELQTSATNAFSAMFHRTTVKNVAVTATYSAIADSKVTLTGSATVPTDFFNLFGFSEIDISATTTTTWGQPQAAGGAPARQYRFDGERQ